MVTYSQVSHEYQDEMFIVVVAGLLCCCFAQAKDVRDGGDHH